MPEPTLTPAALDMLRGEYDNMQSCIRCGLCLSVCPTYQISFAEEEGPRGRIALARGLTEGHLSLTADLIAHQQSCLLCEACTAICPAGVSMEHIGVPLRAVMAEGAPRRSRERFIRSIVFGRLFASMALFRAACAAARLYQRSGLRWLLRRSGVLRLLGLSKLESLLPEMDRRFFTPRNQSQAAEGEPRGRAGVFAGCIMSTAFAETNRATGRVLAANGFEAIACSSQGCCGALHLHNGELEGAKILARRNIDAFAPLNAAPVVVNAAGCGSTLKGYAHLLKDDPDYAGPAAAFSARVQDVSELLASLPLRAPEHSVEQIVTLQEPCHLAHAQRVRAAPRDVLRAIPGVTLVEMDESALCCGSAGVYNVTEPERSRALVQRKLDHALATGAGTIVTANPGCQLQLQAGLRELGAKVAVRHIVDLLDEAYRDPG
ncbi:MAG TPA: heterodisulfide reductase-related iron-sulfur binding cluster [Dehalococcoidia bacterium]|nr:heterodisulfide reductase-related iron-sulfur binding cluster [Dehalococcoidia bacterium]